MKQLLSLLLLLMLSTNGAFAQTNNEIRNKHQDNSVRVTDLNKLPEDTPVSTSPFSDEDEDIKIEDGSDIC